MARFLAQQDRLIDFLHAFEKVDTARIVIPSPVTAWISYSLLDALRIVVAHERRHLDQARRVVEEAGFPSA